MLSRGNWGRMAAIITSLLLVAGCGMGQSTADSASSPTATATATPNPTARATAVPATPTLTITAFTCPVTPTGAGSTLFDYPQMQFGFSYPATWTESECRRMVGTDGQQTVFIGNLFSVTTSPRNGQTIQQWVNTQTNQYEVVTLGPLSLQHAPWAMAAKVSAQPSATSDPSKPFDAEPFASAFAIVAGMHLFYTINGFVAQMNTTDTTPNLSRQQLAQQIVSTFIVP